jgi:hypothetical protein
LIFRSQVAFNNNQWKKNFSFPENLLKRVGIPDLKKRNFMTESLIMPKFEMDCQLENFIFTERFDLSIVHNLAMTMKCTISKNAYTSVSHTLKKVG